MKECCGNNCNNCDEKSHLKEELKDTLEWLRDGIKKNAPLRKLYDRLIEIGYTEGDALDLMRKEKDAIDYKNLSYSANLDFEEKKEESVPHDKISPSMEFYENNSYFLNKYPFGILTGFFSKHFKPIKNQQNFPIFEFENFLTDEECDAVKMVASQYLVPSTVTAKAYGDIDKSSEVDNDLIKNDTRVSKVAFLTKHRNDPPMPTEQQLLTLNIANKIAVALGVHPDRTEGMQVQYYEKGGFFKSHQDAWDPREDIGASWACPENGGNRLYTFMVYLNKPKKGGSTSFSSVTKPNGKPLKLKPKKGKAIVWLNLRPDGLQNPLAMHQGDEIKKGEKWIINLWVRESSEDRPGNLHNFKPGLIAKN